LVCGLALSPDESDLLCSVESRPASSSSSSSSASSSASSASASSVDDSLASCGQLYLLKSFDTDVLHPADMRFELVGGSFHVGAITGLDVCVRKPLLVTCGVDKSLRLWNYQTRTLELCVFFPDTPISVSFHPSGFHLLVGFSDKLRLMNILMSDIKTSREFPIKACGECRFSNGGHLFAAVNSGLIQIYNTWTSEQVCVFRGHTGVVKSLHWSLDDTAIVSAGLDGAVYERRLHTTSRSQEYVQKGCKFTSAVGSEEGKIYAVGDDGVLKEIQERSLTKTIDARVVLTQLALSNPPERMLFAGTAHGVIRAMNFPLDMNVKDFMCHSKAVTRLRVSVDDSLLFSVALDGCLAIFNIEENNARLLKRERMEAVPFAEELLVTSSELDEQNATINQLNTQVEELTASSNYQLREHDSQYQHRLQQVADTYAVKLEHDRRSIEMAQDEKADLEQALDRKLKNFKLSNEEALRKLDMDYTKAIMAEVHKYQKLERQIHQDLRTFTEQMDFQEQAHQEELERLREEYEEQLRKEQWELKQLLEAKQLSVRRYHETRSQLERDTDTEIETLRTKYDTKLHLERDATLRLKGDNGIMQKKFHALQKDIEDQKENKQRLLEKDQELKAQIDMLYGRIALHKEDIEERDKTIGEKERQIYELKRDNQELEKFKFVLDYQIKELKRQIEPRENEIAEMKDKVMQLDQELEHFHKQNGDLTDSVEQLKGQLRVRQADIKQQRQQYRQAWSEWQSMCNDLHQLVQLIQDPHRLKEGVEVLYRSHVREKIESALVDPDVSKEYKRQRAYLEHSVGVLKGQLNQDIKARKSDNMRVMQENVALIKEINKMRREIKLMHQVQRQKEISSATRAPARLSATSSFPSAATAASSSSSSSSSSFLAVDEDDASSPLSASSSALFASPSPPPKSVPMPSADGFDETEVQKTLAMQRAQIRHLRAQIESAQSKLMYTSRPVSRSSFDEPQRDHDDSPRSQTRPASATRRRL